MFISLQLQTEDLTKWIEVDKLLTNSYGLTHIIWGVRGTTPVPVQLPDTLYFGNINMAVGDFRTLLNKELRKLNVGFVLVAMEAKTWGQDSHTVDTTNGSIKSLAENEVDSLCNRTG